LAVGVGISKITPDNTGGPVTTWAVSPALPAGLTFNTADGSISGTPNATAPAATYTVTATNGGGQSTFALKISVQTGTVLDLGHAHPIAVLRFNGTQVLSADITGHWVLWNYATRASIASGDSGCDTSVLPFACGENLLADMVGTVVAIQAPAGFEIRSATDGHILATVAASDTAHSWWRLAADGAYLAAWNSGALKAFSTTNGTQLVAKTGAYQANTVFPAVGQVQAAVVSGTQNVIETTSTSTGMSTSGPSYNGTFQGWFADGASFASAVNGTVLIYSAATTQLDAKAISVGNGIVGTGSWFATLNNNGLDLYKVGAGGNSPVQSYSIFGGAVYSITGSLLVAESPYAPGVTLIDLSGASPVRSDPNTPSTKNVAFAAVSATQWLTGTSFGVIFDGASTVANPRYLGYGTVWDIAGSATRYAVATASGRILFFDATTNTQEGTLSAYSASLAISADGSTLAAAGDNFGAQYNNDLTPRVYTLPGGATLSSFAGARAKIASISAAGTVVGFGGSVYPATGGNATFNFGCDAILFTSDAATVACPALASSSPNPLLIDTQDASQIYTNGTLVTAFKGLAVGWADDGHLVVNSYSVNSPVNPSVTFDGASYYDATGKQLGATPLPQLFRVQPIGSNSFYAPQQNTIYGVAAANPIWTAPYPVLGTGAVAGGNVVFVTGAQVLALPH
jgi:Putative Ig domain